MAPATLSAVGNRIEYQRAGLTGWYVNDERGLEQGFIIDAPPVGILDGEGTGYLVLELAVTGDLSPSLTGHGLAIELTTEGGVRVLRYGSLYVEDAAGRELPAYLAVQSSGISIVVDDSFATYPIVVDPLVTSPSWTAESDQAVAWFGSSVGTAGDVNGDGYSDVIVGARLYDNGQADEGRAFVYHGAAAGLSSTAGWTAEGDQAEAWFGTSVGTAGDVNGDSDVIVWANRYDNGETDEGRAFVYHGAAAGLSATAGWTAESDQANAFFGISVGTAGDVNGDGYSDVIVGACLYDSGQTDEGRAFLFLGVAPPPVVSIADVEVFEDFGSAVMTVSMDSLSASDISVGFATFDGTATAPDDYTSTSGTATIPVGSLSTTVAIPIINDDILEPNETFTVTPSNPNWWRRH